MSQALKFLQGVGVEDTLYSDDVFQSFVRVGTGAEQTVTTNIDMTKGYMAWSKGRSGATDHAIYHSARGVTYDLVSNSTAAQTTQVQGLKSVSATGHTWGTLAKVNTSSATYVDWVVRNAPNFYHHDVVTKSAGSNATYNFSTIGTLGMVRVKRTDSTGSWYIWHRSLTAGKLLIGETTAAEATLGHITVSGTTVTLVNGVIADGTYLVEAFAHDTTTDGIIQCGSFTTDGSGNATVNLGWEPQYLLLKQTNSAAAWCIEDTARGLSVTQYADLYANSSAAEAGGAGTYYQPTATGLKFNGLTGSTTYIYLAIRRPNKPPTSGTQVYNAIARTGTGAAATVTGVGFAPDLIHAKSISVTNIHGFFDRLRGSSPSLDSASTSAEAAQPAGTAELTMDGFNTSGGTGVINSAGGGTYINHFFRRAPGVMDNFCDTGSGANKTESHNLATIPELWLRKGRSGATEWVWGSSLLANTQKIVMPSPNGVVTDATAWNSTYPTATSFSVGTAAAVNTSSATYATYLWATLAGVSKVFSYTGDGGSGKVINCGFSAGARFIMIIRTTASTAQDIFIWDSVRGIIAGNDPHLSLNTTAAEVTTDDSVDPDNSGFAINQVAATNINVNGAVYIGVAYA